MRGAFQVVKHMGEDGDMDMKIKMDKIQEELKEKEEELESLEALNQTLVVKERKSNDELQEARKELISVRIVVNVIILLYVWNESSMKKFFMFYSLIGHWLKLLLMWGNGLIIYWKFYFTFLYYSISGTGQAVLLFLSSKWEI